MSEQKLKWEKLLVHKLIIWGLSPHCDPLYWGNGCGFHVTSSTTQVQGGFKSHCQIFRMDTCQKNECYNQHLTYQKLLYKTQISGVQLCQHTSNLNLKPRMVTNFVTAITAVFSRHGSTPETVPVVWGSVVGCSVDSLGLSPLLQ